MNMKISMDTEKYLQAQKEAIIRSARLLIEKYDEVVGNKTADEAHEFLIFEGVGLLREAQKIDLDTCDQYEPKTVFALNILKMGYFIWSDFLKRLGAYYPVDYRKNSSFWEPDDFSAGDIVAVKVGLGNADTFSKTVLAAIKTEIKRKLNVLREIEFVQVDRKGLYIIPSLPDMLCLGLNNYQGRKLLQKTYPSTHIIEYAIRNIHSPSQHILKKADAWKYLVGMSKVHNFRGNFNDKVYNSKRESLDRYLEKANKDLKELFPFIDNHRMFSSEGADPGTFFYSFYS